MVDNGSRDRTAEVARAAGARVVVEPRRGYGQACLTGIAALGDAADVIVFLDGDHSDHPAQLPDVVAPILAGAGGHGHRLAHPRARGAGQPSLARRPGHAVLRRADEPAHRHPRHRPRALPRHHARARCAALDMRDRNFGWTVEMQVKARRRGAARGRGARRLPPAHRPQQGERHASRAPCARRPRSSARSCATRSARGAGRSSSACRAAVLSALRRLLGRARATRRRDVRRVPGHLRAGLRRLPRRALRGRRGLGPRGLRSCLGAGARVAGRAGGRAAAAVRRHLPLRVGGTHPAPRRQPVRLGGPARGRALGAAARRRVARRHPQVLHRALPAGVADGRARRGRGCTTPSPR